LQVIAEITQTKKKSGLKIVNFIAEKLKFKKIELSLARKIQRVEFTKTRKKLKS
jgi:hypothetical protein